MGLLDRVLVVAAVGTSSTPEGPFKFTNYANAAVKGAGDFVRTNQPSHKSAETFSRPP